MKIDILTKFNYHLFKSNLLFTVTCYTQYCEKIEESEEWECETSESIEQECELKNVCMESQLPSNELNIQQGCKYENFLDDEDDAKILKGETVCDEGYCYCKTNLCNNKNFKMPEKFSLKEAKA